MSEEGMPEGATKDLRVRAEKQTGLELINHFTPTHRHVKTGSLYEKIGVAMHTETGALLVIYCSESGITWARDKLLFEDGRFVELTPFDLEQFMGERAPNGH